MRHRKIALEVALTDDDAEILVQALSDAMEKIEEQVAVFDSEIRIVDTPEPWNAAEVAMQAS